MSAHPPNKVHDADHEARLDTLLAQGDDPQASFAASELAGCEACRSIVAEILAVEARLTRAGALERTELGAALEVERERPAVRSFPGWPTWVGVAAALIVLFLANRWRTDSPLDVPAVPMGTGAGELVRPRAEVEAYAPFEWSIELPPGGHFLVIVRDPEGREVVRSEPVYVDHWSPGANTPTLPSEIEWTVETYSEDASEPQSSASQRARRSP